MARVGGRGPEGSVISYPCFEAIRRGRFGRNQRNDIFARVVLDHHCDLGRFVANVYLCERASASSLHSSHHSRSRIRCVTPVVQVRILVHETRITRGAEISIRHLHFDVHLLHPPFDLAYPPFTSQTHLPRSLPLHAALAPARPTAWADHPSPPLYASSKHTPPSCLRTSPTPRRSCPLARLLCYRSSATRRIQRKSFHRNLERLISRADPPNGTCTSPCSRLPTRDISQVRQLERRGRPGSVRDRNCLCEHASSGRRRKKAKGTHT
jgi:hypothetical protein